jgi:hypothetical protein
MYMNYIQFSWFTCIVYTIYTQVHVSAGSVQQIMPYTSYYVYRRHNSSGKIPLNFRSSSSAVVSRRLSNIPKGSLDLAIEWEEHRSAHDPSPARSPRCNIITVLHDMRPRYLTKVWKRFLLALNTVWDVYFVGRRQRIPLSVGPE